MSDVLIVGGGVIGLSVAYELAGQGVSVTVLEQGQFGQEASWAGAGILPPGNPEHASNPRSLLRAHSHVLWPQLSAELLEKTGVDNGFRQCGGIEVRFEPKADPLRDEVLREETQNWRDEGVVVEPLSPDELAEWEPAINREAVAGYRLPEMGQIRNPRHLKALLAGCADRGVELLAGRPVVDFDMQHGKVVAARTPSETFSAGQFCVAGGAWSRQLLQRAGVQVAVEPVRGQIVLLSMQPLPFRHVILEEARYLVPRPDGRILVGSTEEWVGFDKRNTAEAVGGLIEFAVRVVPSLCGAKYERAWSGLRPGSPDRLPYLGPVPETENLFVAAGHFRSGLQMSPATAVLMRQLMLGQAPLFPLDAFACDRHAAVTFSRAPEGSAKE